MPLVWIHAIGWCQWGSVGFPGLVKLLRLVNLLKVTGINRGEGICEIIDLVIVFAFIETITSLNSSETIGIGIVLLYGLTLIWINRIQQHYGKIIGLIILGEL